MERFLYVDPSLEGSQGALGRPPSWGGWVSPGPSSEAGWERRTGLAPVPAHEEGGSLGLRVLYCRSGRSFARPSQWSLSCAGDLNQSQFGPAARLRSRQALLKQAVCNSWGWLRGASGQLGTLQCRCLSLNVQSCKSRDPDWRELKACCSFPINSTVCCQPSPDWQSSTHQFKRAFLVIEERSVGWIQIRVRSLWAGSILWKTSDTLLGHKS